VRVRRLHKYRRPPPFPSTLPSFNLLSLYSSQPYPNFSTPCFLEIPTLYKMSRVQDPQDCIYEGVVSGSNSNIEESAEAQLTPPTLKSLLTCLFRRSMYGVDFPDALTNSFAAHGGQGWLGYIDLLSLKYGVLYVQGKYFIR